MALCMTLCTNLTSGLSVNNLICFSFVFSLTISVVIQRRECTLIQLQQKGCREFEKIICFKLSTQLITADKTRKWYSMSRNQSPSLSNKFFCFVDFSFWLELEPECVSVPYFVNIKIQGFSEKRSSKIQMTLE